MHSALFELLFNLAKAGLICWALVIFLPRWRVTRWIVEEGIFPLYLSVLYAIAFYLMAREMGSQVFLIDFNSYDSVRGLFAGEFWSVFWLHILAFDQVVAMLIYADNQNGRYIPIWVQSIVLLAVLYVGPVGMLAYLVLRFRNRNALQPRAGAGGHAAASRTPAAAAV